MWLDLLKSAVEETSARAAADAMGVSRTYVSRVINDHIQVADVSPKFIKRVIDAFGRVECPHLGQEISLVECRNYHQSEVPTSSPRAMKHWRACQGCPHNAGKEKS